MRNRIERVLLWVSAALGLMIIGSCTAMGSLDNLPGVVLWLVSGLIATALLMGWLYGYLLLRRDIAKLRADLSALEQRIDGTVTQVSASSAGQTQTSTSSRQPKVWRRALSVLIVLILVLLVLAARRNVKPVAVTPDPKQETLPALPAATNAASIPSNITQEERISWVIAESVGVPLADVTPNATLKDLQADSLDRVELAMHLETEFSIVISDEVACSPSVTVEEIVRYVQERLEQSQAQANEVRRRH